MLEGVGKQFELLVCWDFDNTLVKGHFHNDLAGKNVLPGDGVVHLDNLINQYGLRSPRAICNSIKTTIEFGGKVAIVSYSAYPEIIKPTLKKMGLPENIINQIYICTGLPSDNNPQSPLGKNEHIQSAMKHFSIENNYNIILVDDDETNLLAARKNFHNGIHAPIPFYDKNDIVIPEFVKLVDSTAHSIIAVQNKPLDNSSYKNSILTAYNSELADGSKLRPKKTRTKRFKAKLRMGRK